ncbi:type II secretion system secretin GspD [Pseudorhodoferax sp. Leaf274]|uniref:type II secretion system secretin GspD n=1 Tax=Pseudorhodoferax sp. Leaf274 TaxID=1736318 RepID=UPI0007029659|nr:type II secretion system secretin GspD [Pseudorhodoferax sp. Leaf274]KQP48598.1 type II secretion system protein GspD [Pseudorhodoferax sp. Leaf274]
MHSFLNRRPAHPTPRACALAAALLCSAAAALAQVPPAPPQPGAPAVVPQGATGPSTVSLVPSGPRRGDPVTLNFMNADIEAVARTMATITGRNVVVDPRVKGTMNLSTDQPVPPSVAYSQFIAALRMQGFTVVDAAGLDKVVPEADAKLQGGPVRVSEGGDDGLPSGSQIVTQIFRLNHESANNLVPVLRPLISPNNTINANPGTNSLVITDYADNLRRLARVIAAMDVSNATDVEVIPLRHAIASDLAPLVSRLIEPGSGGGTAAPAAGQAADTSYRTTMMAEPRSNALVVRASNAARMNLIRSLVARLDQPPAPGSSAATGNIHVVYLKNADAVKLAATLRAAISAGNAGGSGAQGSGSLPSSGSSNLGTMQTSLGSNNSSSSAGLGSSSSSSFGSSMGAGSLSQGNSNQPSTGGQIQADPSTNSLIISAPEPQYRQLRAVIDRLDGRRAQVLVESLIVEVNAEKAAEFGIQWSALLGGTNLAALGTNFSVGGKNIFTIAPGLINGSGTTTTGQTAVPSTGANLGYIYQKNGNSVLGFLARFLESQGDGNVLSTPNLLTLDNEEARIIIGENVPFVTGSYTNSSSTTTVNPFTTVERQDVGLTLRVRPQINENGTVKMVIYQESSNVKSGTENAANGPTTTKRAIESTVLVDDGSIVVLGGLLQDQYSGNQEKVPGVGDIPIFGNLFRSEARTRKKTNLMVFLRPVVVRDNQSAEALSMDRYDLMRVGQQQAQPKESSLVRVNEAPVLPEQPLRRLTPAAAAVPAPLLPPSTNLQTQPPGSTPQPVNPQ